MKVSEALVTIFNPLSANPTKLPTNCLSAFDHFVGLALKGLRHSKWCHEKRIQSFLCFEILELKMKHLIHAHQQRCSTCTKAVNNGWPENCIRFVLVAALTSIKLIVGCDETFK